MPRKKPKLEEIVAKLRQVDVMTSQGGRREAIRSIGVSEVNYHRWRNECGVICHLMVDEQHRHLRNLPNSDQQPLCL